MHRYLIPKLVGAVVLMGVLGGGVASAFTNSNSVTPSFAGEGVGSVSGYVVSNVSYTLQPSGGSGPSFGQNANIGGVTFTLNHDAKTVGYLLYVGTSAQGGGTCTNANGGQAGTTWTCTASPAQNGNGGGWVTVSAVTGLDVIAAN
jgi:hypothetical protein